MRLKYYIVTLRQMNLRKSFVFLTISIVFLSVILIKLYGNIKPALESLCNSNAKAVALRSTEKAVNKYIKQVDYNELMSVQKNNDGSIQSINANVVSMNKLATDIAESIQTELEKNSFGNITLPFGSIIGTQVLGGYGPKIKIKTVVTGSIMVKFKSSFDEAGVNQTRHRIVAEITTKTKTISPIYTDMQEYVKELTVAETVIIGSSPSTYYNITGLENFEKRDALDILE